jgi:hypothetical protein
VYKIGNTVVNVSMRQSIDSALKRIENYSYSMRDGVWISDFNVTGTKARIYLKRERTVCTLSLLAGLAVSKQNVSWHGLLVHVWADSGEAFDVSNIA